MTRPTYAVLDTSGVTAATITATDLGAVVELPPVTSATVSDQTTFAVIDPAGTQALIAWFY